MVRTKQTARRSVPTHEEIQIAYAMAKIQDWHYRNSPSPSTPTFLKKIQRKHLVDIGMKRKRDAFEAEFKEELDDVIDEDSCVVCESRWHLLCPFNQDCRCKCVAHPECAQAMREGKMPAFTCEYCM